MIAALMVVGIVTSFIMVLVRGARRRSLERISKLQLIAAFLGGAHDETGKAWGEKLGPKTTLDLTTRGSGSSSENWTYVDVELPPAYPLVLNIRRHGSSDHRAVAREAMVDVIVGDKPFDDAFLVEAAPSDVVRELLDPALRTYLLAHKEIDLTTVEQGGRRILRLAIRGWLEKLDDARPALEVAAGVGARLRDVYAKVDQAVERSEAGSPYRPVADDRPAQEAQATREAEVAFIHAVQAKRAEEARRAAMLVLGVIGAIVVASIAISTCH
jgi:hypothetical protein